MAEFIEAVHNYPWTTFWIFIMVLIIISAIKDCIHGDN